MTDIHLVPNDPKETAMEDPNVVGIEAVVEKGESPMASVFVGQRSGEKEPVYDKIGTARTGAKGVLVRIKGRTVRFTWSALMDAAVMALENADER